GRGAGPSSHVDVRVITATNRDLAGAVTARDFRDDLYYRLNVLRLRIPPLRERGTDIVVLLEHYLEVFASQHRVGPLALAPEAIDRLTGYPCAGNVRELKTVGERLVLRARGSVIEAADLPQELTPSPSRPAGVEKEKVPSSAPAVPDSR